VYVASIDSQNPAEINAVFLQGKYKWGISCLREELKNSLERWANNYINGI